jgi:hypothetical protein
MHLLGQEFFAKRTEEVRLDKHIELEFSQELAFHPVQLAVAEDWEQLGQAAVSNRFVLPHFVR